MSWTGRQVTSARAYWRRQLEAGPLPCARCPRLVYVEQAWQVEHVEARTDGGALGRSNQWVSHAHCNASHGGKIGAARRNLRRPTVVEQQASERSRGIRGW